MNNIISYKSLKYKQNRRLILQSQMSTKEVLSYLVNILPDNGLIKGQFETKTREQRRSSIVRIANIFRAQEERVAKCMCCGSTERIVVDHIKPRRKYPQLALDFDNLQVLCVDCNHGKGSDDETDWRKISL
jgi:5-methylcytosine-specific restriction endonuclease McrA